MVSKCIIVLGRHRSGTSTVAGILHNLGVYMGQTLLYKHFEDTRLIKLNEKLIGQWMWPRLNQPFKSYKKYVESRQKDKLWGAKDPRLCFAFPIFLKYIKATTEVKVICTKRFILNSAHSLVKRNGIELKSAMRICEEYDNARECSLRNFTGEKIHINYDDLLENKMNILSKICDFVQLPLNQNTIDFVDPNLRHNKEKHIKIF